MLPPFRDSYLTRLLKSSFIGKGKSIIIVTLNPSSEYLDESMNTIRFAKYARKIKTRVSKNEINQVSNLKSVSALKDEIQMLKFRLSTNQVNVDRPQASICRVNKQLKLENEKLRWLYDSKKMDQVLKENAQLKQKIEELQSYKDKERSTSQEASQRVASELMFSTRSVTDEVQYKKSASVHKGPRAQSRDSRADYFSINSDSRGNGLQNTIKISQNSVSSTDPKNFNKTQPRASRFAGIHNFHLPSDAEESKSFINTRLKTLENEVSLASPGDFSPVQIRNSNALPPLNRSHFCSPQKPSQGAADLEFKSKLTEHTDNAINSRSGKNKIMSNHSPIIEAEFQEFDFTVRLPGIQTEERESFRSHRQPSPVKPVRLQLQRQRSQNDLSDSRRVNTEEVEAPTPQSRISWQNSTHKRELEHYFSQKRMQSSKFKDSFNSNSMSRLYKKESSALPELKASLFKSEINRGYEKRINKMKKELEEMQRHAQD